MKEIFETLSKIDLSEMVEKKMNLTYLSWANAWQVVMDNYPSSNFEILDPVKFDDGSMEVWCSVTINEHTRKMWLPVMDHRNNSIINPSSRQVSDARMRCLVKCLAMFGLGLYIYRGEDLPRQEAVDPLPAIKEIMAQADQDSLLSAFRRLTNGHAKQSDYYRQLTKAASNRKEELNNEQA
jgi:hypothetical protein